MEKISEKAKVKNNKACNTTGQTTATSNRGAPVTIPYCTGLSERVKKDLQVIHTAFKPVNKLRNRLVHVKDKPPRSKHSNLVYGFKCIVHDCPEAYVEEIKQSLNQHRRPSSSDYRANSAIYEHSQRSGHQIKEDDVVVLDREEPVV